MNDTSYLRIGLLLPEVLGTYGDSGNAEILKIRAEKRGIPAEIIHVSIGQKIPQNLDIYTLGGGEDTAQAIAAHHLKTDDGLAKAVEKGAVVLGICAAMQVLGQWYLDAQGNKVAGAGLLDVVTVPQGGRAIGEILTKPALAELTEQLVGFENHGGATLLGADAHPLGYVQAGIGNGQAGVAPEKAHSVSDATQNVVNADSIRENTDIPAGYRSREGEHIFEGATQGSIIATYMHGPVLARNPELADLLIARATALALPPLEIPGISRLRAERIAVARKHNE
ncbi:MAG: glutamine amidotransferase [Actinomycetaceae bacterium]|nr:glutamine amidotransferase [Actinomycetaceae bacterium]